MPTDPNFSITAVNSFLSLSDTVLLIFYAAAVIYLVFSGIFYYHWQQYSTNAAVTWVTYVTYTLTTVPLFLIMAALAFTI